MRRNEHVGAPCRKPWLWWRRVGSLWACPTCYRVWVVEASVGYKFWALVKTTVNAVQEDRDEQ